jgi:hypothetical protein
LLLFRWVPRYVYFIHVFLWLVPTGGCQPDHFILECIDCI